MVVGAVMFLFSGEFGCMLNTGYFRWEENCERAKLAKEMLLNALKGDAVDVLYLDNTYCNPTFQFSPREVAAKQVLFKIPNRDFSSNILFLS